MDETPRLFTPVHFAGRAVSHRVVMAPMTRCRASQPGDVPTALNARYYSQRATAALIITEASQISPQGKGYSLTPGIHSDEHVIGWRLVTDAVHAAGGRIFLQLWHVGRMSHPDFHGGELPVAPSAVAFDAQVWMADPATGIGRMVQCPTPRALTLGEIKEVVADFGRAARRAMTAGFDGVEIHGANGYLVDQFLRTTSNLRTDVYGGTRENRVRFLQEVVDTVASAVGIERTGIRLAPFLTARGMGCPDILPTILLATEFLQARGIGYLHLVEADWDDAPQFSEDFRRGIRARLQRPIVVAGKYDKNRAEWVLSRGYADLVAFGRSFIANPDLPRRIYEDLPLADFDGDRLFGGDERGYADYPPWSAGSSVSGISGPDIAVQARALVSDS